MNPTTKSALGVASTFLNVLFDTIETNKIMKENALNGKVFVESKTDMTPYFISVGIAVLFVFIIIIVLR